MEGEGSTTLNSFWVLGKSVARSLAAVARFLNNSFCVASAMSVKGMARLDSHEVMPVLPASGETAGVTGSELA